MTFWQAALIASFFNLLIYLVKLPGTVTPTMDFLALFYVLVMALINAALYCRTKTILAPFLCNATFRILTLLC